MYDAGTVELPERFLRSQPEGISVVLVDDERDVLELGEDYLRMVCDEPFDIATTTSPGDVIEAVERDEVDCIVSDYDMPEMDGLDLLHRVKQLDPHLPFILFTARGSEEVASQAITEGITDYLQKEFSGDRFELLANRIHNAVEHYWMVNGHMRRTTLLTDVANNISESVFVTGEDGAVHYLSDVIEDVYGVPKREMEEDPFAFLEYVHPADTRRLEEWMGEMDAAAGAGDWDDEYQVEYRFDHPRKGWRWIRTTVNPVFDGDGNYSRMVGTATDVTGEKEAIDKLERSEETFRSIAELSNDVIYRVDMEGRLTYVSPSANEMLGYDPETLQGEQFIGFIAPDDREEAIAAFTEGVGGATQSEVEFDIQHAEGGTVTVEVNQSIIHEDGEVVGVQGVARDVTGRKERERERKQYETIVETVPDGVFVLDEEGRILVANDQAIRLDGHDPEELDPPTPPITELDGEGVASSEARERYTAAVEELLASEDTQTKYRLPLTVEGSQRVLEFHIRLRPADGGFRGTVGVVRDVTERVQYERRLERQNDHLEQFASTISHDLRNPLNVAMGRLALAREEYASPHIEAVADNHERMNALIDDILTLARQGKTVDDSGPISLPDAARRAWRAVETAGAELTVEEGFDEEVWADESRIRQLLENLFRNAVDHGGTGVSVTVAPLSGGGGFFVSDDGEGIPAERRERVFEQGFTTAESTGFGLAIVEDIAEAHDWSISVSEGVDGGARFELRFGSLQGREDLDAETVAE